MNEAAALARWLVCPTREPIPIGVSAAQSDARAAADLLALANEHALTPLLHYRAKVAALTFTPTLAAAVRREYHLSLARNVYFYECLRELADVCAALRVELIVLKGAQLAAQYYPTLATRPMVDVDVLLARDDLPRIVDALRTRGYRIVNPEPRAGALQFENVVLLARAHTREHSPLGLHWTLLDDPFYQRILRVDDFRADARDAELSGMRCKVLAPEALLVYLAAHLALHHQWSRLLWECDLALVLAREPLNWDRVLALTQTNQLTLAVRETLRRVSEHFTLGVPREVWTHLDSSAITRAERQTWYVRTSGSQRSAGRAFWFDLQAVSGVRARAVFAWSHLFPSLSYMQRRYALSHRAQLPLAYVRRWWRGVRSLGARGRV